MNLASFISGAVIVGGIYAILQLSAWYSPANQETRYDHERGLNPSWTDEGEYFPPDYEGSALPVVPGVPRYPASATSPGPVRLSVEDLG